MGRLGDALQVLHNLVVVEIVEKSGTWSQG
jgi:hypothetical protein